MIVTHPVILPPDPKDELVDGNPYLTKEIIDKEKKLNYKRNELNARKIINTEIKEDFIRKFIRLLHHDCDRHKNFYTFKIGRYKIKKSLMMEHIDIINKVTVYNGKKILFKIKNDFPGMGDFDIVKFDSEAIYELQEFYNLWIDIINKKLKIEENELDEVDLTNLSLKELI